MEYDTLKLNMHDSKAMNFHNGNEIIGTLFFEKPMRFEGDVTESAKMFIDEVIKLTR